MAQRMGVLARMHVKRKFSRKAFGERFQSIFQSDIKKHDASATFLLSCAVTVLFILKPFSFACAFVENMLYCVVAEGRRRVE